MRALCGAIITAGALIGLGFAAIGHGLRYQSYSSQNDPQWVLFHNEDTSLMVTLIVLLASLGIGIATAFIGLAYHHHRRHHEFLHEKERLSKAGSAV